MLTSAVAQTARVVAVSSEGHRMFGHIDLEDLHWRRRKYSAFGAYGDYLLLISISLLTRVTLLQCVCKNPG